MNELFDPGIVLLAFVTGAVASMLLTASIIRRSAATHSLLREAEFKTAMTQVESDLKADRARLETELQALKAQLSQSESLLIARNEKIDELAAECAELKSEIAAERVRLEKERQAGAEKLALLEEARERLAKEFQNLANRIFDEKADRFSKSSKSLLDTTLGPLREQLGEFRRRVDQVYATDSEGRVRLLHEIASLKDINQRMSEEAVNLTRALKGESKTQGSWGEIVLERVLEESGLTKGREFETQLKFTSDEGRHRMPDVVVRLPEAKDVVIDAKVSLVDYERHCSATDESERERALARHVRSLRNHIENLSIKDYEGLDGIRSLDFVLVFVPIESAFVAALEADPDMFRRAYDRNIIVVSPTTLLATLRTIQSIWRYERQNRNAEQIAQRAGRLHDQFVLVLESLSELGRSLQRAQEAYQMTLGRFTEGRGNLVRQVELLEELGARTRKRIPDALRNDADSDDALSIENSAEESHAGAETAAETTNQND